MLFLQYLCWVKQITTFSYDGTFHFEQENLLLPYKLSNLQALNAGEKKELPELLDHCSIQPEATQNTCQSYFSDECMYRIHVPSTSRT